MPKSGATVIGRGASASITGNMLTTAGAVIAVAVTAVCISMGCTVYVDSGGGTKDAGPNTNYYTTTYNVHSKTGISGITISNIKCKSDGSGSFVIKKANYSSAE